MKYFPSSILSGTIQEVIAYVQREFRRIADVFANPEPYWTGMCHPGDVGKPGSAAPSFTTVVGNIKQYLFGATTDEEMHFSLCLPPNYKEYTDVYFSVTWAPNGTDTGVCRWGMEYTTALAEGGAAFPATTTLYLEDAGGGVAAAPQMIFSSAVDGSTFKAGQVFPLRLFRHGTHANDTLTNGAFMFRVAIHYITDTPGMERLQIKRVTI